MNFSSMDFWLALAIGLLGITCLKLCSKWLFHGDGSNTVDRVLLAGLSLSLLCYQSALTLAIFLFVMVITYFSLLYIRHMPAHFRKVGLGALVALQFAPLIWYKYAGFISGVLTGTTTDYFITLMIPVGISFYTFQMVGFVIDYYRSHTDYPSFLDCLNFSSFFPQIIAGPIERKERLLPQVQQFRLRWNWDHVESGCKWIVLGLFLKLALADNLAAAVPWVRAPSSNPFVVWVASFVFGLRIYFDFAGYSLIALGLGRFFGIKLILNFSSPYTAVNIQEFWHRWHVSLSTWFRDYVYFPLGGNRCKRWAINVLIVFVVSGVWHGAGWNFVLWGAAHGLLFIAFRILTPVRRRVPASLAWAINMLFVTLTWLFFYQTDSQILFAKLGVLADPRGYSLHNIVQLKATFGSLGDLMNAGVWIALSMAVVFTEYVSLRVRGCPYALMRRNRVSLVLAAATVIVAPIVENGFIYFSF